MSYFSIPTLANRSRVSKIAFPIVAAALSQTVMSLVDIGMVGRLGAAAVAGVGLAGITTFSIIVLFSAIQNGVQTVAARRVGEERFGDVGDTFRVSLRFALVVGNIAALAFIFFAPQVFPYMNSDPEVVSIGIGYLFYRGLSLGMVMMGAVYFGFYNAIGETKIHMVVTLIANTLNVVFNYGLIFGRLGMPEMGAVGAGLATALASGISLLLYTIAALRIKYRSTYPRMWRGPRDSVTLQKVLSLSLPASLHEVGVLTSFVVFMILMGRISTTSLATAEILINILSFAFLPATGFAAATQTLVSESLGREKPGEAMTLTQTATLQCMVFMGLLGLLFIFIPVLVLSLFTNDSEIIRLGVPALRLMGFLQLADAVGMVHFGALRGAGDVLFPAISEVALVWLVFLPLAWYLGISLGYDVLGGFIALAVHVVAYSTVFLTRFLFGPWRDIKI